METFLLKYFGSFIVNIRYRLVSQSVIATTTATITTVCRCLFLLQLFVSERMFQIVWQLKRNRLAIKKFQILFKVAARTVSIYESYRM
jgi:hypothetical protein